jgi:hypothetical protein
MTWYMTWQVLRMLSGLMRLDEKQIIDSYLGDTQIVPAISGGSSGEKDYHGG